MVDIDEKKETNGDSNDEDQPKLKREKGTLNEDELAEIWDNARELAYEQIDESQRQEDEEYEGEEPASGDEEDMKEDDENGKTNPGASAAIRSAPQAIMSLSAVHKFMTTGLVE